MSGIERCPICEEFFDLNNDQGNLTCGHPSCVEEAKKLIAYKKIFEMEQQIKNLLGTIEHLKRK